MDNKYREKIYEDLLDEYIRSINAAIFAMSNQNFPKGGFVNNATEKIINPKNTVTIGPNDEPKTRKNRLHSRRKYLTSKLRKINSHLIKTRIDD